jgi:hypothetical protein
VSFIGILRSVGDGARAVTSSAVRVKPAGQNPESTKGALYSHAPFAAGIQSLARENMALSAVSAVVSSSWLLRAAAFQKAPFKVAFAGSNPNAASQCGSPISISACARTADIQIRVSVK